MAFLVVGGRDAARILWDSEEDPMRHVSNRSSVQGSPGPGSSLPSANGPWDSGAVEAHIDATAPHSLLEIKGFRDLCETPRGGSRRSILRLMGRGKFHSLPMAEEPRARASRRPVRKGHRDPSIDDSCYGGIATG